MTTVGRVFRHAFVFGTAPALQKLAALLLLPYFTHFLTPADYGVIEVITFWTSLFLVLFGCECRAGLLWRLTATGGPDARRRVFTAALWFIVAVASLAVVLFVAIGPMLLQTQLLRAPEPSLVLVLAGCLGSDIVGIVVVAALQAELRAARMVTLGLVQFTVDALLKILFVAQLGMGVHGFFLASVIASAANTLLALLSVRGLLTPHVTALDLRRECAAMLRYSAPLLMGSLAYLLVRKIDRPMLAEALSLAALGVYGRASRLTQLVLDFYVLPFQRSFDVWRLEVHERRLDLAQVARVYRFFMLGAGLVATGVATFGCDLFTSLADPDFVAVREQVPLLNVAVLCQCGATVVASAFFVTQRTSTWMWIFLVGLAIEIVVVLLTARPLGIPGVALALGCTHAFLYAAAAFFGRRLWPVPYRHGEAVLAIFVASAVSLARVWLPAGPFWLAVSIDAALVLGYLTFAVPFARVSAAEWSMLRSRLVARLSRR
ncbi:MAG TPA: oligosaccharide flippase family protein [Planctomycetota bacterium]|nr:oligosaccharide flippase family protein [Planctomycetota bacterium]